MPTTPNKLNLNFAKNAYSVFGTRGNVKRNENQREQKTELLEGTRGNGLSHLKNGVDYVNPGEEEQMEIYGYRKNETKTFLTWLAILFSGGFLRLIFHWIPQLMISFTHSKCSLEEADTLLLIENFQGKHPRYYVEKLKIITAKDVVKNSASVDKEKLNEDELNETKNPDVPSEIIVTKEEEEIQEMLSIHLHGEKFKQVSSVLTFECKKVTYAWDTDRCEFMKLIGLDNGVLLSTLHQMPGLSRHEQFLRLNVYGNNEIEINVEPFWKLLYRELLTPFYVFQIFSFILWICDEYYSYAAFIGAMSGGGILMAAWQTRKNQHGLRSKLHSSDVATVIRDRRTGERDTVPAESLVPGDIVIIPPHGCLMSCDAVLLTGNCILNESMLTGESVPVTKTPIPIANNINYDTKEHARHTLFCGTKVIQTRYYGGENVLAVVVRTGYSTSKGELVRSILYPAPVDFKFEKDSYKFVTGLAVIACAAALYTIITKISMGYSTSLSLRRALDLFTILVPPALPAAMTVGRLIAQRRLEKNRIYCTSPPAINISGCIDCICFDKTGTLTEDGLDMWGIVEVDNKKFMTPEKNIKSLPINDTLIGMATCHGITIIDGQLAGDPLDLKMFESTGWILEEPDVSDQSKFLILHPTVVKPPNDKLYQTPNEILNNSSVIRQNSLTSDIIDDVSLNNSMISDTEITDQGLQIAIFKQFQFSSSLQRMSVITRILGAPNFVLYCKGSPEMILSLSKPESIPSNFSSILREYTSEGYRVIALARKTLNRIPFTKFDRITRESVEIDLTFLGFVILENRLKPETTPVIEELNRANMKIVMITGDNMLTALSVARDCDLIKPELSVITVAAILQQNQLKPQLYFTKSNSQTSPLSPNGNGSISEMTDINSIASLETIESGSFTGGGNNGVNYLTDHINTNSKYVFSMTGTTWTIVKQHYPDLIPKLVTRGAIFARMSPDHKKQLVMELQSMGYYVAMVGDGANDCGALKAAHTGISLSDTESSIASPFTSRETNISCVLSIVREGRAALVTSFGTFKYMAGYSLVQFMSVMLLYNIGSNLTDIQYLYIDLFVISIFAYFNGNTHAYDGPLAKRTPHTSLISISTIISLFLQIITMAVFQFSALWHVKHTDGFTPFVPPEITDNEEGEIKCYENYTTFILSSMQYIILGIVFSKGHPYRKRIFTNYGLLASFIVLSLFSIYLAVFPSDLVIDKFELELPPDKSFRVIIIFYGFLNFIVSLFAENFIIDYLLVKKLRHKWHNIDKSKKKFLAVERDMGKNIKWPPLSQEPLPEATPDILIRQNTVNEIKIEKILPDSNGYQNETGFTNNSPAISVDFKRFGSAREVTLNPRSLFTNKRDSISMQTVPTGIDDRELNKIKQPKLEFTLKRRHNSESENGVVGASPNRIKQINPIATLPRNHQTGQQNQKLNRNKNEEGKSVTQSFLELDILPS